VWRELRRELADDLRAAVEPAGGDLEPLLRGGEPLGGPGRDSIEDLIDHGGGTGAVGVGSAVAVAAGVVAAAVGLLCFLDIVVLLDASTRRVTACDVYAARQGLGASEVPSDDKNLCVSDRMRGTEAPSS
jgi:hypothetical protein